MFSSGSSEVSPLLGPQSQTKSIYIRPKAGCMTSESIMGEQVLRKAYT
jgi:hypothetical protein